MRSLIVLFALSMLVFADDGELKWSFEAGGGVTSPAIGYDGTVYFGSGDGYLYAFTSTGDEVWKYPASKGVSSAPTVGSDGTIYFGCSDSCLYALTPTGELKWKCPTNGSVTGSPAIGSDDILYVGSRGAYLYAVTTAGEPVWVYQTEYYSDDVFAPVIGPDGSIYIGMEWALFSVSPSGEKLWEHHRYDLGVSSSPAIGADSTIYYGAEGLYALTPAGVQKWQNFTHLIGYYSPAIGSDNTIYVTSWDQKLHAVNPEDGKNKWLCQVDYFVTSGIAVGSDGVIYFGTRGGYFYAINPDSTLRWRYEVGDQVNCSPAITSDSTIYFEAGNTLYALECSSQGLADSPWPKFQHDNQNTGRFGTSTSVIERPTESSTDLRLSSHLISGKMRINYVLPEGQVGRIAVYNVVGQRLEQVRVTSSGEVGFRDHFTKGVYHVRLESGGSSATAKAVIMR